MSIPWAWLPVTKPTSSHKGAALGWQRKIPVSERGHLWRGVPALGSEQGGHPWTWLCLTHKTVALHVELQQTAAKLRGHLAIRAPPGSSCHRGPRRAKWKDVPLTVWGKGDKKQNCSLTEAVLQGRGPWAWSLTLGFQPCSVGQAWLSVAISLCRMGLISVFWVLIVKWDVYQKMCG